MVELDVGGPLSHSVHYSDARVRSKRGFPPAQCHKNGGIACVYLVTKGRGAYGIRTRDLLNAIEALYQLS